jgi:hypothetical protein
MSGPDKGRLDPNATIQLDQVAGLEDVELIDSEEPATNPVPEERAGETPPPLPPPGPGATTPSGSGRTIAYAALICVVVAAAVAAGLLVGNSVRRAQAPAPAASTAAAAPTAGPTSPAAPSSSTLVLPPVEIRTK